MQTSTIIVMLFIMPPVQPYPLTQHICNIHTRDTTKTPTYRKINELNYLSYFIILAGG